MKIIEIWKIFESFLERKSLLATLVIGVSKIIVVILIPIMIVLSFNLYDQWKIKTAREEIFLELVKSSGHDEKIIGIKSFKLSSVINIVDSKNTKGSIPEVPENSIIQRDGKKIAYLWRAMPKFFPDVERWSHPSRCVQGRVRKKLSDMSFEKFEDKFFVMYTNSVPTESAEASKARLEFIFYENEKKKEEWEKGLSVEKIDSHSALFSGNCIDTFQGWISGEED